MQKQFSKSSFQKLGNAINRLQEAVDHPELGTNAFIQDALMQRFEFSIEFFWKILKKILMHEGIEATIPRDIFAKAFQFSLIVDENIWIEMIEARNTISHIYDQDEARRIAEKIKTIYFPIMNAAYQNLQKRVDTYA